MNMQIAIDSEEGKGVTVKLTFSKAGFIDGAGVDASAFFLHFGKVNVILFNGNYI